MTKTTLIDFTGFHKITLAKKTDKTNKLSKVIIRPILIKNQTFAQIEEFKDNQAFHKNISTDELNSFVTNYLENYFMEIYVLFESHEMYGRRNKNNEFSFRKTKAKQTRTLNMSHDKDKNYILKNNLIIPPLIELGIMDKSGIVFKSKMDKFIQINNFLNILDQASNDMIKTGNKIHILDLCCGKSYLTFILYYFFEKIKKIDFQLTGVDMKSDVIKKCNDIKNNLGYNNLEFIESDITKYKHKSQIDIVISLHACDIATDIVLQSAVKNNAKLILSVPCCHKELQNQIHHPDLEFALKYGLLKSRFAAIITDALRANYLENNGYKTDILEFVDFENTPKNVMIRAAFNDKKQNNDLEKIVKDLEINPSILK